MPCLGRLGSKIEGGNNANCDSSNEQFTHDTLLSSGHGASVLSRLTPYALPNLLPVVAWASGGISMRIIIVCTIVLAAAIGLGGCFFHGWHQQAVTTQPLK